MSKKNELSSNSLRELNEYMVDTWLTNSPIQASLNEDAFTKVLKDKGRISRLDYSTGIRKNIVFSGDIAHSTNSSGDGMLKINEQAVYSARVEWKTIAAHITIPNDIITGDSNKEKKAKGAFEHITKGINSVKNSIILQAWGDGTGNNGLDLDGLAIAVSKTPETTVYADIDPKVIKQWRNFAANASDENTILPNAGKPLNEENIMSVINFVMNRLTPSGGQGIDLICVSDRYYNMINDAMMKKQIMVNTTDESLSGFRILKHNNALIVSLGGRKNAGTPPISDNEIYFLNTTDIDLFFYNNGDGSLGKEFSIKSDDPLGDLIYPESSDGLILRKAENLDYFVNLVFKGNLLLGDRQKHGVIYEDLTVLPSK